MAAKTKTIDEDTDCRVSVIGVPQEGSSQFEAYRY